MPDCDIAVVGAGIIGEAVAYELVTRGASVILIDARGAGLGSTQAAAGMLVPFLEGFGGPLLPLATRSLECTTRLSSASHAMQEWAWATGAEALCKSPRPMSMPTSCGSLPPSCAAWESIASCSTRARFARPTAAVGGRLVRCLVKSHGFVVTSDLSGALTAAASSAACASGFPRACAGFTAATVMSKSLWSMTIRSIASQVVVAAGSWSGQIVIDGVPPLPVRPVRGQLLQLAWDGPPLQRIVWGPRCYLVPSTPGTILVGATVEEGGLR